MAAGWAAGYRSQGLVVGATGCRRVRGHPDRVRHGREPLRAPSQLTSVTREPRGVRVPVQTLGQRAAMCREPLHLARERFRLSGTPERHDRVGDEVGGDAREVGSDARTRAGPAPHPPLAGTTSLSAPTDAGRFVEQRTSGAAAGCRQGARENRQAHATPAWRSRMIVPRTPDARRPGPSGPDRSSPSGGSCSRATLASADRWPSCQLISSLTASGRFVAANPAALAAYAAAPKACAPI